MLSTDSFDLAECESELGASTGGKHTFSISLGMSSASLSLRVCCLAAVEAKRAVWANDERGVCEKR